ncbi:MAG TPA: 4-demethylwyosine synthase TYW1 [Candidatus Aenigmarchaeota archaeon]|nr:4-demethylwyosine synthase TYW1 [Candidatus Aenigmarchaeota archaeon]
MMEIPEEIKKIMRKQHYKLVGEHSAVKLCHWLRKSIRDEGFCYKQKFYGIESHRCLQMSPAAFFCTNRCVMCWRSFRTTAGLDMSNIKIDPPEKILDWCIKAQRELISGFGGFSGTNRKKWREAHNPTNIAISLVGEPTLYPRLSELIEEAGRRGMSTFLVSNGQVPERFLDLTEPTNLYISLDAPDKETYKKVDCPQLPDFWERLNRTLEVLNSFSCRKVARLTLIKGWNDRKPEGYAKLIEKGGFDFIEVKAYMHIGESRKRLPREAMPSHEYVREFAEKISEETGYAYRDEQRESRVVLLVRD